MDELHMPKLVPLPIPTKGRLYLSRYCDVDLSYLAMETLGRLEVLPAKWSIDCDSKRFCL